MPEEKTCSFNRACGSATDAAESFLGSLFDAKQKIHTESGKEFGTDPGKSSDNTEFSLHFQAS